MRSTGSTSSAAKTPDTPARSTADELGEQALRSVELAVNKPRVEDQLRLDIADLGLAPRLDLALHRLEVSLAAVNSNGKDFIQNLCQGIVRSWGYYGNEAQNHTHL